MRLVRLSRRALSRGLRLGGSLALLAALCFYPHTTPARPQGTTVLAPDASAVKARQVIQQAIQALGGPAYLGVKDVTRTGRYASFEHNGSSRGSIQITTWSKPPDRERILYQTKVYYTDVPTPIGIWWPVHKSGSVYQVRNGDQAWVLGSAGVEDMSPDSKARIRDAAKKDINALFRSRLDEPGLILRYTGQSQPYASGEALADANGVVTIPGVVVYKWAGTQVVILQFTSQTGVGDLAHGGLALSGLANPLRGSCSFEVTWPAAGRGSVDVFDVSGRRVRSVFSGTVLAGRQRAVLDASAIAPGVYVVRARQGARLATRTIAIVR